MSRLTFLDGTPDTVTEEEHFLVNLHMWDWKMTIDLTEMCNAAGKRIRGYDQRGNEYYHVDIPISQLKKAMKMIRKYGEADLCDEVEHYLDEKYPRWAKEWAKVSG